MRLKTHALIVNMAYKSIKSYLPVKFKYNRMVLGSIMPDIAPHRRVKLHNQLRTRKEGKLFLRRIKAKKYIYSSSYVAGIMSHYISDNFCYAHNYYVRDLSKHRKYEVMMQEKLEEYKELEMNIADIFENWNLLHHKGLEVYLEEKERIYAEELNLLEGEEEKMLLDIKNSILHSAVWMMEVAYVSASDKFEYQIEKLPIGIAV